MLRKDSGKERKKRGIAPHDAMSRLGVICYSAQTVRMFS